MADRYEKDYYAPEIDRMCRDVADDVDEIRGQLDDIEEALDTILEILTNDTDSPPTA